MKTIDLHVHSCYSDGTCTPAEIVDLAIDHHLSAIALTDHDTVAGVAEMKAAQEKLMTGAQALFTKVYEQAQAAGAGAQAGPDMSGAGAAGQSTDSGAADDVVDGDYREV